MHVSKIPVTNNFLNENKSTKLSHQPFKNISRILDEFGEVTYSLSGESSSQFTIEPHSGVMSVAEGAALDREVSGDVWLRAIASDGAPAHGRRTSSVPVSTCHRFLFLLPPGEVNGE